MKIAWMNPAKITNVTIHCTATPEGRDNTAAEVTRWDIERFKQPSYHWVVELDGEAVRTLNDNQRGAHTGGHNTGNIGISYVGGTATMNSGGKPKDTRTEAQKKTIKRLVDEYRVKYPNVIVQGHRDFPKVAKACPCFNAGIEYAKK